MKRRTFLSSASTVASSAFPLLQFSDARAQNAQDGIVLGCTSALSGPLGNFGQVMKSGVDAALLQINKQGGIHGREMSIHMMDDAYVATRSVENVKKLIDNTQIVALMGCLGTPNNAAITPLIEASGIAHLAPLTGANSLRKSEVRNVFHLRASYADEMQHLVQSLVSMRIKELAIVYLDNSYGREVVDDANRALNQVGIKALATVALNTEGKNLDQVLSTVMAAKPSAVLLGTAGTATSALVAALRKSSPMLPIAGLSASFTVEGINKLGAAAHGIGMTTVYPDVFQGKHRVVREYQAAMTAAGTPAFSSGSLEGYISTRIMAEALQRAGKNANRDKLRQAVAGIRQFDLGGFTVDFGNNNHVGSKFVALGVLNAQARLVI